MKMTEAQEKVVNAKTGNLLVSSGAGSGKTTVLTERVISLLRDKNYKLDEMIILTFTDLAAKEMKDRIIDKLSKENNSRLKEELNHIDEASIQTFDSFCHDFIIKYSVYTDVESSFSIGDEALFEMKKREYIKDILDGYYNNPNKDFDDLIDSFQGREEKPLIEYLSTLYDKIANIYDSRAFLEDYDNRFYRGDFYSKCLVEYKNMLKDKINFIGEMETEKVSDVNLNDYLEKVKNSFKKAEEEDSLDSIITFVNTYKIPASPKSTMLDDIEKSIYTREKDAIRILFKNLKKAVPFSSTDEVYDSFMSMRNISALITEILLSLDSKMNDFKKSHSLYSFMDIEKKTIEILSKNKDIRQYYRDHIREILVDEYQDTNDIGDYLISLISSDNVMMVGDIKQSIYRFRNANPDIFRKKYEAFSKSEGGEAINLIENFRSRKAEVIDPVNKIFSSLMNEEISGINYKNEKLEYGNKIYDTVSYPQDKFRIIRVDDEKENEYDLIAYDIRRRIDENQLVIDKKTGETRKAKFSDFLVLSFSATHFNDMVNSFDKFSIPSKVFSAKRFNKSEEIIFLKNALKLTYFLNKGQSEAPEFNMTLLSLLRSFVINVSDDMILSYFERKKEDDNLSSFKILFSSLYNTFSLLSSQLNSSNIYLTSMDILKRFNVYEKLIYLGDVEEREIKLNTILSKFKTMSGAEISIDEAISYFDFLYKNDQDFDQKQNDLDNLDCVQIMTMHKSKGLEAPFVYITNLSKTMKSDKTIFTSGYGYNLKDKTSPQYIISSQLEQKEIKREMIRVLYVALTRARESLTLLFSSKTEDYLMDLENASSFQKILLMKNAWLYEQSENLEIKTEKNPLPAYIPNVIPEPFKYTPLNIGKKILIETEKASHDVFEMNEDIKEKLDKGNEIHALFEKIYFLKDIDNEIERNKIPESYQTYVRNFKAQPIFKEKNIREFHELPYFFNNNYGIIDFIIEEINKFVIIDFKLKDIDNPLYRNQLHVYKEYLSNRTNKNIETYLYSIITNELRRIE